MIKKAIFTSTYSERTHWLQRYEHLINSYKQKPPSTDSECDSFKAEITTLFQLVQENRIEAEEELKTLTNILSHLKHPLNPQEAAVAQETCIENNGRRMNENIAEIVMEGSGEQVNQANEMAAESEHNYEDYVNFEKKINEIKQEINKIILIKDFQTKKAEFEKLMSKKPELQKTAALRDWLENSGLPLYNQELETLNKNIRECQAWCQKVREYFEKYEKDMTNDGVIIESSQIREMTRGINLLKEEMNLLLLKEGGLENKIPIFDWGFQAKLFLSSGGKGLPQSDIKYWKDLLNKAQEGRRNEILESERYKEICKQVVKYEGLIEQVQEIENQEALLLKPGSNRREIEAAGKGFKDHESMENLLKKLMECKVLTSKGEMLLQEILAKANKAMIEYYKMKQSPAYIPLSKFRLIAKQLQLLPLKLPQEIEEQILKETRISELLREETNHSSFDFMKRVYNEYQGCHLDIPEAQEISKKYSQVAHVLRGIENLVQGRKTFSYEEIKNLEKQAECLSLDSSGFNLNEITAKIWLAKVGLFKNLKENPSQKPEKKIPLQKIQEYLHKGYDHLDHIHGNKDMLAACKDSIHFLEDLIREIEGFRAKICSSEDPRKETSPLLRFIDMEEKIAEQKVAAVQKKVAEQPNQSVLQKRPEPSLSVQTAVTSHKEEENSKSFISQEEITKKLRTDTLGAGLQRQVSQEVRNEEGEKLDWATREKARGKFEEYVMKLEGCEVLKDVREVAKELERKVEARYFLNKANYEKRAKSICHFLVELRGYPFLRRKLLRQGLEYGDIRSYLDTDLAVFDTEAYEEERKHSRKLELGLEKLFAMKEGNLSSGQLPVWTPPRDFKFPDISGLTMPDKVVKMTLERREGHMGMEIERKENLQVSGHFELPKLGTLEPSEVQRIPPVHIVKSSSYQQNIYLPGGIAAVLDKDQQREPSEHSSRDDEKKQKVIELQRKEETRVMTVQKPAFLIKRIFFGRVSQKVSGSFTDRLPCSFDTYASRDQIYQIPRLMNSLPYFDTAAAGPFLQYINNFVNKNKTPFQKVLVGWVSAPSFYSELFTSISQYFIEKRCVGFYSYLPGAEIYLVPSGLVEGEYARLKQALNWVCQDPEEAPEPDKQLLFAFCVTDKYEDRSNTEMMRALNVFRGKSSRGAVEGDLDEGESPVKERVIKSKDKHDKKDYKKYGNKYDKKHDQKKKKWKR